MRGVSLFWILSCSAEVLLRPLFFVTSPAPCKNRKERGTLLLCLRGFGYGLDLGDFFFDRFFFCGYGFVVFLLIVFFLIILATPGVFA